MTRLVRHFESSYYIEVFAVLAALIALRVYLKRDPGLRYRPFAAYLISYCVLMLIVWSPYLIPSKTIAGYAYDLLIYLDFAFTHLEFLVFHSFIVQLTSKYVRLLVYLKLLFVSFSASFLLFSLIKHQRLESYVLYLFFTIQATCLIITSFIKLLELFESDTDLELTQNPSFWISTSILLVTISTLPYSILLNIHSIDPTIIKLYILFPLFYILLFVFITKAFYANSE